VAIYALGELEPTISTDAFVHPDATIIGSVTIGAQSSIWPGAVLRGDGGTIVIGARTSVQDNAVIHTTPVWPTIVGNDCVLGHLIHLEGCTIEDEVLIGNASMVLHRCIIRTRSIVAANAVVLNGMEVPTGAIAVGTPATIKEGRARPDEIELASHEYVRRADQYRRELRRLD
jgi:carbonic anhydrase/acetyltransferase-like protein (isoleucine patch superfamily)